MVRQKVGQDDAKRGRLLDAQLQLYYVEGVLMMRQEVEQDNAKGRGLLPSIEIENLARISRGLLLERMRRMG